MEKKFSSALFSIGQLDKILLHSILAHCIKVKQYLSGFHR